MQEVVKNGLLSIGMAKGDQYYHLQSQDLKACLQSN
jgi:hypothetical protein